MRKLGFLLKYMLSKNFIALFMGDTVANSRLFDIYVEAQAGTLNHEDFFTAFHKADFNESTEFMAELAQTNNVNHASGAPTILEAYAVKWSDKNVPKTEKINALVECLFKTSNLQCHLQAPSSYFNNFLKFVDCYDLLKDMHDDFQKNQKSDKISRDQKNFFYGEFPVEPTVAFRYPWLHLIRMEKSDEASTALRDNLDHVLRYVFKDDGVMNDYLVKNILNIGSKETIECLLEKVDPNDRNGRLLYWNITSPTDYQVNTKEVNKNTTSVLLTRLDRSSNDTQSYHPRLCA